MQGNVDIRVRGVVKKYGNRAGNAVDHIDLDVRSGEFLGLLGPNGAGKTSLISIITGVRSASAGSVLIKDHDVANVPDVVHECIGFVPVSYTHLRAHETVLDLVCRLLLEKKKNKKKIKKIKKKTRARSKRADKRRKPHT